MFIEGRKRRKDRGRKVERIICLSIVEEKVL